MQHLAQPVHHHHDGIVTLTVREASNEIHSDDFPDVLGNLSRHKLSNWFGREDLGPGAPVTAFDVKGYVSGHARPPVVPRDQFYCLSSSWMTCCLAIMMKLHNPPSKLHVSRNIDLSSKENKTLFF